MLDTSAAVPAGVGLPDLHPHNSYWSNFTAMTTFWLERCRTSPAPLVEKMVLFWHGHLCCSLDKVFERHHLFNQNQPFRTQGLGSFHDLVLNASVQPAMLYYLDNDRNVAGSPNDNFARELMELFTMGQGHYSELDVVESARAWTGYYVDEAGAARFDPAAHDHGPKTFLGSTARWTGPAIIHHLLHGPTQMTVARFIGAKLWSFLAYPDPEDEVVESVARAFAQSNINITSLVRAILLHPQFRSTRARQGLIRSPIEYVVAAMRAADVGCDVAHPEWTLGTMGQRPFFPPNVAGWKPGLGWVGAAAVWGKVKFASHIRWELFRQGNLEASRDLGPAGAADAALARFGITNPSAATRQALVDYVTTERQHTNWAERAGLLLLPLLSPELQMA